MTNEPFCKKFYPMRVGQWTLKPGQLGDINCDAYLKFLEDIEPFWGQDAERALKSVETLDKEGTLLVTVYAIMPRQEKQLPHQRPPRGPRGPNQYA